jgi:hypothetical protein
MIIFVYVTLLYVAALCEERFLVLSQTSGVLNMIKWAVSSMITG